MTCFLSNLATSIFSFRKYLFNIYHVPGSILGAGHTAVNRKAPVLIQLTRI